LFNLYLEIAILTRWKGGLLKRTVLIAPSKSFLKQWVQATRGIWGQTTESNTKDTGGVLRVCNPANFRITAAAGDATHGIALGTGTAAVAIDNYKLQTQINHGSGAGQLDHKAQTLDAFQVVGSVASFRNRRQFENLSGSTITVKETGIYARDSVGQYFCTVRDLLVSTQDVLNGQIIEARYTFRATV